MTKHLREINLKEEWFMVAGYLDSGPVEKGASHFMADGRKRIGEKSRGGRGREQDMPFKDMQQ